MTRLPIFIFLFHFIANSLPSTVEAETELILECYQCGVEENDSFCPKNTAKWVKKQCRTTAKLSNDEALSCTKTVFEDVREEEIRTRRSCSVVKLSLLGNCSKVDVSYDQKTVKGETCYCHDKELCNSSTNITLSIFLFIKAMLLAIFV